MAHLSCEVHDVREGAHAEQPRQQRGIVQVSIHDVDTIRQRMRLPRAFQRDWVVVIEIVEPQHTCPQVRTGISEQTHVLCA